MAKYCFPAVFTPEDGGYSVDFPDLEGCYTCGDSLPEALEMADMGLIPAGAYRNRDVAEQAAEVRGDVSRAMQDILYDPQTSGGLLIAVDEREVEALCRRLRDSGETAAIVGYVKAFDGKAIRVYE